MLLAAPQGRTAKALTNCDLTVLRKKDVDIVLQKFPELFDDITGFAKVTHILFFLHIERSEIYQTALLNLESMILLYQEERKPFVRKCL